MASRTVPIQTSVGQFLKDDFSWGAPTVPIATGVTGLGTNVAAFLATPSSANLAAAVTDETGSGALVLATSPTLTTPVIASITNTGTLTLPTSTDTLVGKATTDTFTNKTFDTGGTGNSLKVGGIPITGAFRTGSSNAIALVGGLVAELVATQTLTNKRITKRAPTVTQSATPTINTDNTDVAHITGLAQAITSFTTNLSGTPVEGDTLRIDITDNGTARAITWGTSFEASTVALPTTTVISTRLDVGFVWNSVTSKWRCVAVA